MAIVLYFKCPLFSIHFPGKIQTNPSYETNTDIEPRRTRRTAKKKREKGKKEERKRGRAEEQKKQKRRGEEGFLILIFSQLPRFLASALPVFSRVSRATSSRSSRLKKNLGIYKIFFLLYNCLELKNS